MTASNQNDVVRASPSCVSLMTVTSVGEVTARPDSTAAGREEWHTTHHRPAGKSSARGVVATELLLAPVLVLCGSRLVASTAVDVGSSRTHTRGSPTAATESCGERSRCALAGTWASPSAVWAKGLATCPRREGSRCKAPRSELKRSSMPSDTACRRRTVATLHWCAVADRRASCALKRFGTAAPDAAPATDRCMPRDSN